MKLLADLLPHLLWALSVAHQLYLYLQHGTHKGTVMSEAQNLITGEANSIPGMNAPIATQAAADNAAVAPVNPASVVNSVIQTVQAHPDVHPSKVASVAAAILAGLYAAEPAIFQVSRASQRTQDQVSLYTGLAGVILGALLHPGA